VNHEEAKAALRAEFLRLQAAGYTELAGRLAGKQERSDLTSPSGATYHVELEGFWDDQEHRDLRVVASIDDGGLRAFLPFTDAFTISPSGSITEHSAV
jgi:hypothetical protein